VRVLVAALREAVQRDDVGEIERAYRGLRSLGPGAVSEVQAALGGVKDETRWFVALLDLATSGSANEATSATLRDLRSARCRGDGGKTRPGVGAAFERLRGDVLPALLAMLRSGDEGAARTALDGIAALGPSARGAVPALMRYLSSPSPGPVSRRDVLECLQCLGPAAAEAVPALSALLTAGEDTKHAATTLARIGPDAIPAFIALLRKAASAAWDDEEADEARLYAALALRDIGEPARGAAPVLVALLDELPPIACAAMEALVRTGAIQAALPSLLRGLGAAEDERREDAIRLLSCIDIPDSDLLPLLTQALSDPDEYVRRGATEALAQLRSAAAEADVPPGNRDEASLDASDGAIAALLVRARGAGPQARQRALHDLAVIGARCCRVRRVILDALVNALRDADRDVRRAAAAGLVRLRLLPENKGARHAARMMRSALGDSDAAVRSAVATALAQIAEVDSRVAPALVKALGDPAYDVRGAVEEALREVPGAAPHLARMLRAKDADVRRRAAALLGSGSDSCGSPASAAVVRALARVVGDANVAARSAAVQAFQHWTHCALAAVPALFRTLSAPRAVARQGALQALARLDQIPAAVEPAVLRALRDDPSPAVRQAAALAAGRLGGAAVPALVLALGDEDPGVQEAAEQAFFTVGAPAVAALVKATTSNDSDRARHAEAALRWERTERPAARPPTAKDGIAPPVADFAPAAKESAPRRLRRWPDPFDGIAQTVRALGVFNRGGSKPDGDIPEAARPLLMRLKRALRDAAAQLLDAAGGRGGSPRRLTNRFARALKRRVGAGPCTGPPRFDFFGQQPMGTCPFGAVEAVDFARPRGHADLMALKTTIGIPCGTDSSLYLFRREGGGWRLAFALESNDYAQVSGALGSFDYAVSPPAGDGGFFIVTADVNPWCWSNWQSLRTHVFRPAGDPYTPTVLRSDSRTIFLGMGEPFFKLVAGGEGYALFYPADQGFEGGFVRKHVEKYWVADDRVVRLRPIASDPLGFVAEWLDLPWELASLNSDPSRPEIKRWHVTARLLRSMMSASAATGREPDPSGMHEIMLEFERRHSCRLGQHECGSADWGTLHLTVGERGGAYFMAHVRATLPEGSAAAVTLRDGGRSSETPETR
jgi:HEAT repeat protein